MDPESPVPDPGVRVVAPERGVVRGVPYLLPVPPAPGVIVVDAVAQRAARVAAN